MGLLCTQPTAKKNARKCNIEVRKFRSEQVTRVQKNGTKPVVGFIAGQTAPKGRTMGHAGAIVGGKDDTAEAKMRILSQCGVHVVESPAQIGAKIAELIGVSV